MKKILIFLFFIIFFTNAYSDSKFSKELKKISKNNGFVDNKGKVYSREQISDKKNTILIIYNHGSGADTSQDQCKAKPKKGYIWEGAVVPALLKLHNKENQNSKLIKIPICTDEEFSLDIKRLSEKLKIKDDQIYNSFFNKEYYCYMTGFIAGMPFLGDTK